MHNGESVVNQGSRIMIVPSGDLTFDPVANDDEGTYQCFARNSAGVDDASITLTVFGNSICTYIMCAYTYTVNWDVLLVNSLVVKYSDVY